MFAELTVSLALNAKLANEMVVVLGSTTRMIVDDRSVFVTSYAILF
jgi:hypothetical protein